MRLFGCLVVFFNGIVCQVLSPQDRHGLNIQYVGIPVPGQNMNPSDMIQLYVDSCRQDSDSLASSITNSLNLLSTSRGAETANQLYRGLFANIEATDISRLIGRWYTVIDSPTVHQQVACSVTTFKPLHNSTFLTTLTAKTYFRNLDTGAVQVNQGYISKVGPEPGHIMYFTGNDADICPYLLVKLGPETSEGYNYMVWTQLLKQPVLVFAKDWEMFDLFYKREVVAFLESRNFINTITRQLGMVQLQNYTKCPTMYYDTLNF